MVEHAETEIQRVQIPASEAQTCAKCMNRNLRNLWQERHALPNIVLVKISSDTLYYFNAFSNVLVEWKKQSNI